MKSLLAALGGFNAQVVNWAQMRDCRFDVHRVPELLEEPKFTGKLLDERLGKITFWTLFIGFHGAFLVQHWLGAEGMPRRYADYLAADGFTALNTVSTISAFLLGLSILPFF